MLINSKLYINKNKKQYHKHPKANKNKEDKEGKYTTPLLLAQMKEMCNCWWKPGQKSTYCRTKDKITKYEWAINKAKQHVQIKSQVEVVYPPRKNIRWVDGKDYTVHSRKQSIWNNWYYWTVTPWTQFYVIQNTYQTYEIWIIHWVSIQMEG